MDQKERWGDSIAEKSLIGICLLVGLTGVVASKGITVLVSLSGFACLAAFFPLKKQSPRVVTFFSVSLALLIVWAGISSIWALKESSALNLCIRLVFLCFAGFILLHASTTASSVVKKKSRKALLIGYGISLLALATGYGYAKEVGNSLWGSYYFDPLTTLNNGAVIVALLLWPVTLIIWRRFNPTAATFVLLIVSGGLMFLSSGAALLAIGVGGLAFIICLLFGRPAGVVIAIVTAGLFFLAPAISEKIPTSDTITAMFENAPPSVEHRLLMWNFVSQKIEESPYWGLGMDSSRHIPQDDFRLNSNMEIMPLHPHNAALQIRLELGVPGIALAIVLILSMFWTILKDASSRQQMAIRMSVLCAYLSVGAVSYGVWQSWWIATAWVLAAFVQIALPADQSRIP